jgi:damage-control phosphatase, subfamily I
MSIDSDCIICMMRQALDVCNFIAVDESVKQSVLKRVMQILISGIDANPSDGFNYLVHEELKKLTNHADPYKNVKDESIKKALEIYPSMKKLVEESDEQLKTAVELCIAGNVIDFGPSNMHDIEASIDEVLHLKKQHFDFNSFQNEINNSKTILILGDNAGETVFDLILMQKMNHRIFYAVKSNPNLNDALLEDAINSGIGEAATIIENGSSMPGTDLPSCSQDFLNLFYSMDMIISKGQANFESLVNEDRRIFFLLKVKCKPLSRKYNLPLGEFVLLDNKKLKTIN